MLTENMDMAEVKAFIQTIELHKPLVYLDDDNALLVKCRTCPDAQWVIGERVGSNILGSCTTWDTLSEMVGLTCGGA